MDVKNKFRHVIQNQTDLAPSTTVVLAVSGGVDSMVLLHLMKTLPAHIKPHLVVCHVNHKLRSESDREQDLLETYFLQENLVYETAVWDKEQHPESGIEDAARRFRYTFFREIMIKYNADVLMTGHHQDDQAETVLMRLVRGGHWQRLKGIEFSSNFYGRKLIRPLLTIEKKDLYAYAEKMDIPFAEDATNLENDYTRNRFRNQILPLMKQENDQATYHIAQTAKEIQKIQKVLQIFYDSKREVVLRKNGTTLSRKALLNEQAEIAKFIFSYWLSSFFEKREEEISPETIENIFLWVQEGDPNASWNLPGNFEIVREYDLISLRKKTKKTPEKMNPQSLSLNTWHSLPYGGKIGLFESKEGLEELQKNMKAEYVIINASSISWPLWVRNRQAGDKISLKGMDGTKKIKDIFIDQKVPLNQRDQAYVLVDNEDEIIWLINYKKTKLSTDLKIDTLQYILLYKE